MSRFANLSERLRAELPEGASSRLAAHRIAHDSKLTGAEARAAKRIGADAVAMLRKRAANGSTSALDELQRLDLPATAPASTAKATASTAPAPVASVTPKAPAKSASKIAAEAYAERAAKVMGSPAAIGKAKAAAQLLGQTKCSADQIISFLATEVPTDAVREQAQMDAMWKRAVASANARAGFPTDTKEPEPAKPAASNDDLWSRAVAKANAANGFPIDAVEPGKSNASTKGQDNVWASAIAKVNALNGFSGDAA